jgi:hypothetical protein
MAQTPQEFFEKYMKWFALAFLILFLFKSVQSCNRNMSYNVKDKGVKYLIDSLEKKIDVLEGENKQLSFELKLQSEKAGEAQKRAEAIQSVAEKIKSNTTTTVNVRGNVDRDTLKNK